MLFQDYANAIRRLVWRFECWRAEVQAAGAEEQRRKALDREKVHDSRFDRLSWSHDGLIRWERTLNIQHREWEAEKERVVSLFEEKVRIVEAREDSILYQERDVEARCLELNEREDCVLAKEREYNKLVYDVQAEAFRFRREYRFHHNIIN